MHDGGKNGCLDNGGIFKVEGKIMRQFLDGKYHRTLADIVSTNETMYSLKDFVGEL